MKRKITIKRLSGSDLTLFETQYRNTPGAKQKAINLDRDVFIDGLFPGLPQRINLTDGRVIVSLLVYGPGGADAHGITRKILKQQKNWRLNGELIVNPPEEPQRYDALQKGDFAIIDFAGEVEPHTARVYLISGAMPRDKALHSALDAKYGALFTQHKGMAEIDQESLANVVDGVGLSDGHPVLDLVDLDALEDAAQGGLEGAAKLQQRRRARGVTSEELGRAKRSAEQIGRLGEEVLDAWLDSQQRAGVGHEYIWESVLNAVSPYDFTLLEKKTPARRIDAKSTAGDFRNPIHVSMAELLEMAEGDLPYDIYRLYGVGEATARLRIVSNLRPFAAAVLMNLSGLPEYVTVDAISIKPQALNFEREIQIDLAENEEKDADDTTAP
ncbi:hypothetical protein CCR95_12195 [Thiocystis minor]|uniref:DUF3883 domain-containing protein n=1 Tax=Thiocystis minor TaxID=61597 RepID=UPI0019112EF5|nr:DUF3883 domain-containing protein [Thiocystis minor]MBK5964821.1 hypothetical protein [Thiocystis minor]